MPTNFLNFGPELDRIDANVKAILSALPLLGTLANQAKILENLSQILMWPTARPATSVVIGVTRYSPKHGGPALPGSFTVTDDHIAHTPVLWADDVGPVTPPSDAVVTSADPTVCTVAFNSAKTDVDTTPVATTGTTTWTVSSASLNISDMVSVTVAIPTASSVTANAGGTTFTPKP